MKQEQEALQGCLQVILKVKGKRLLRPFDGHILFIVSLGSSPRHSLACQAHHGGHVLGSDAVCLNTTQVNARLCFLESGG